MAEVSTGGPGTELRAILRDVLRISKEPDETASGHLNQMDEWGPDGCAKNKDIIVRWLRENAVKESLPFDTFCAIGAVDAAIRRAEEKALP